jgi:hypothetical protein
VTPKIRLKSSLFIFLVLVLAVPAPAFAYGDPSGGYLFQILTPILALLWGTWLAFAHTIQKWLGSMVNRMKGKTSADRSQGQDGEEETLSQSVEQAGVSE